MPIFEKNKKRILFVHIPKTGGTTIEHLFPNNGYKMDKFNPKEATSQQHAIAETYKEWGDFTSCFTIVRNPIDRFISELNWRNIKLNNLHSAVINFFSKVKKDKFFNGNHMRNQSDFISETIDHIYRFEEDFFNQICDDYNLTQREFFKKEVSIKNIKREHLTKQHLDLIISYYEKDFINFNYNIED